MLEELSVIIPTLNSGAELDRLLKQLDGVGEVIVSDGGSAKDPEGVRFINGPPGRGGQLARGAAAANGEWFLFLHADSLLPDDWRAIIVANMIDPWQAAAFRLRFDSAGPASRIVACWANIRSQLGLPYGDQGLLISKEHYAAIGGYPDIPLMEDVAIIRAVKGKVSLMPSKITTSGRKYERDGWFRRGAVNMWTLLRYFFGVNPENLARDYVRRDQP